MILSRFLTTPLSLTAPCSRQTGGLARYAVYLMVLLVFAGHAQASNRVALVIGNAAYPDMPLQNPRNDAIAMKKALQQAGFTVVSALDADLKTMQQVVLDFVSQLNASSTAMVFYAGHGMQANGRNYLLPVDAVIETERSLRFNSLELSDLLEELEASNARIKLVVLDACRNNPFERAMRGSGRGLAAVDAARGTLIAYATSPGATASDGDGDNGLYTQALLENLLKPGLQVEEVFKKVRIAVADASRGAQIPWESSSLTGDFVFVAGGSHASKTKPDPNMSANADVTPIVQPRTVDHEALYWESVKDSRDEKLLQAYIDQYPRGAFVELAKLKQAALSKNSPMSANLDTQRPALLKDNAVVAPGCDDLSGNWQSQSSSKAPCAPREFSYTQTGERTYSVYAAACGTPLKATAYQRDSRTLVVDWKMATCSGTSTYQFNDDCSVAEGRVAVNRHMLCRVKDASETLTRVRE